MAVVGDRIAERAAEDFGRSAPRVVSALERLAVSPSADPERIQAAVLLASRGDLTMLDDALEHAADDWPDLLDRAGLAGADWRDRLDDALGRG
ncbi:hypothetical protein QQX09_02730 [Demequina sp. SYSU T00192]|uniref:Uncharacterized protein n=1 Tax=Demequina litoralis TaxID=3051660 RepID=A0ABT8G6K3_9MICO|nr:hypothetical protein [Demequina sp. SYSU T00192]MDN4474766.1 hypothetical protein [Demequina sp. SYSU T00192]